MFEGENNQLMKRFVNDFEQFAKDVHTIMIVLGDIHEDLHAIANHFNPSVVGINIVPGKPTSHVHNQQGDTDMASIVQVRLSKASGLKKASMGVKGALISSFVLLDNEDDTFAVSGVDAAGNPVDISAVATLTPVPTSDNPSVLTVGAVDPAKPMSFPVAAVGPLGVANVTATATWNDGSLGPFAFTLPVTVQAGAAGGIEIVPGTPTVIQVVTPPAPAAPKPAGGAKI